MIDHTGPKVNILHLIGDDLVPANTGENAMRVFDALLAGGAIIGHADGTWTIDAAKTDEIWDAAVAHP